MSFNRWKYLLPGFRRAAERDMQEEMDALAALADRRELGNLTLAAENARAAWGWSWLESIGRDVQYAFRVLRRQPGFTAVAVLSLALGIGANAAIFSLIDALLWRDLPVSNPGRLVKLGECCSSHFTFRRFQENSSEVLSGVLATSGVLTRDIDTGGGAEAGQVDLVSGNYFSELGVPPALGRTLSPDDDRRSAPAHAAVLSYRYWQRAYGGARDAIGRGIRIQKIPFTIVGVAPREFFGLRVGEGADVWIPLSLQPAVFPGRNWLDSPNDNFLDLFGRLKSGIRVSQASTALSPLAQRIDIERAGPGLPDWVRKQIESEQMDLQPAGKGVSSLRSRFAEPLRVIFAMVGIALLLACVNVMGLQFARTDERRRELSVRLSIGAGRWRIVRQLLIESVVIAAGGAGAGLALCRPAAAGLISLISQNGNPVLLDLRMDGSVLLFVVAVSAVAALICGVVPAVRATRGSLAASLQQGARAVTAARGYRALGRATASVQLALSVVLVAGAFLFAFSLRNLTTFDTGIDRRSLHQIDVDSTEAGYEGPAMSALNRRLQDRLSTLPNVQSVTYSSNGVYSGSNSETGVESEALPGIAGPEHHAIFHHVGPRYCAGIGAHLLAGRDVSERDDPAAAPVAIVSQAFARHFFPDTNPIGRTFNMATGKGKQSWQVVGVVADIRTSARRRPQWVFYLPQSQSRQSVFTTRFLLRTRRPNAAIASDVRLVVRAEDPALRIDSIDSADTLLNRTIDRDRLTAALSFGFGILAIALAAVGIYGLLAYDVARRTSEIGIRMALGATRISVVGLVFREVALLAAVGVAAGGIAASVLGRLVAKLVFGLQPADPRVLAGTIALLAMVALAASAIPARRAASLDPMAALRHE